MRKLLSTIGAAACAAVLLGCSNGEPPGAPTPSPPAAGEDGPSEPADPAGEGFDRDAARAEAEALLGRPEAEIVESRELRIVRRGDERFAVTMDLRPGRKNVELDEDGDGRYVVTRVVVETPDGDNLAAE